MADNVAITAGSGTTIAADDIGGVLTQRVKVQWGPDGTVNDTDVASGKPIPAQLRVSDGTAWTYGSGAIAAGTPRVTLATDSPGIITTGTAGSASSVVLTVQGVTSMTPVAVNVASGGIASGGVASGAVASGAFASGALASGSIAAGAIAAGATSIADNEDAASADGDRGAKMLVVRKATPANTSGTDGDYEFPQISAGSLWTASVATDKTLVSERVINGGSQYETVAASQTAQAMGATGAAGDYLSHVIVSPGTAGCGVVTILDNATTIVAFPGGGTTALSNLIPFIIPVGIISTSGAWKITTGANVTCVGVGRFT